MNPSIYSIVSTIFAFVILMVYYYTNAPDFVKENDVPAVSTTVPKRVFSLRLALIYALMFSSSIGLLVLGVSSIMKNYKNDESSFSESDSESSSSESSIIY